MKYRIEDTSSPSSEPITLAEAKDFLQIGNTDQDTELEKEIIAARQLCEKYSNTYIAQREISVHVSTSFLTGKVIDIPAFPVSSISKIILIDKDEAEHEITDYVRKGQKIYIRDEPEPNYNLLEVEPYRIDVVVGNSTVSEKIKYAIKLTMAYFWKQRPDDEDNYITRRLPASVKFLLGRHKTFW